MHANVKGFQNHGFYFVCYSEIWNWSWSCNEFSCAWWIHRIIVTAVLSIKAKVVWIFMVKVGRGCKEWNLFNYSTLTNMWTHGYGGFCSEVLTRQKTLLLIQHGTHVISVCLQILLSSGFLKTYLLIVKKI